MFTARVWKNTGYNGINIPDGPSVLEALPHTDFPALDILTDIGLDHVKLHGTQSDFANIDYVKVGTVYYKVFDVPVPLNGDTWQIPLVADGVTTAGGISNITFLDGVTTRVSTASDDFGEFCIEDELLTPSEPLQLEVDPISVDHKTYKDENDNIVQNPNWSENVFVETTLDLGLMACVDGSVVYTDSNGNDVVVPHSYPKLGRHTEFTFAGLPGVDTKITLYPVPNNSDGLNPVHEGIQKARALGIESAIFNQVSIPYDFAINTNQQQEVYAGNDGQAICHFEDQDGVEHFRTDLGVYNGFGGVTVDDTVTTTYLFVRSMAGRTGTIPTMFSFNYDNNVKNKRVLYGGNNRIGILTTAGNRLESNPEELVGGNQTAPRVIYKGDPHLEGCPYYRFEYINGQDSEGQSFFFNAIKGLQWKKVPLIFSETSGSALNTVEFENSRRIADWNFERSVSGITRNVLGNRNVMGTAAGAGVVAGTAGIFADTTAAAGMATTGMLAMPMLAPVAAGAAVGAAVLGYKSDTDYGKYENAKISEMSALAAKNNVSSPTIAISYDAEAFRDFYGEVLFTYRYRPTNRDIARMDKLLTMYGYKASIPVEDVNLNSRTKFNYLEADVSVGGDIPMWLKEIIQAQLSAGVRIWHKKPSVSDYLDNPIRS